MLMRSSTTTKPSSRHVLSSTTRLETASELLSKTCMVGMEIPCGGVSVRLSRSMSCVSWRVVWSWHLVSFHWQSPREHMFRRRTLLQMKRAT